MKLLTATAETQGQRGNDFAWCIPGEVVMPVPDSGICERDRVDPEGGCGCGRSFIGLNSHRGTTTAIVADIDGYTLGDLAKAVSSSRQQSGWGEDIAVRLAAELAETAAGYETGDVLEVLLGTITRRRQAR